MKKALKKIAMILVVVLLANSVMGCVFINPAAGWDYGPLAQSVDLILLIGGSVILIGILIDVFVLDGAFTGIGVGEAEHSNPSLAAASGDFSSRSQTCAVPDLIKQSSLMPALNALSETQIDTFTQKVQAVPETEIISFMHCLNGIPQTDITFRLNALSETELFTTVEYLNSLSEIQFSALLRNIQNAER